MVFAPLAGIRVVEMSHMIMGPSCGMFLAMLGADVIKVEPPGGDRTRALSGMGAGFFPLFNRGKRSIRLDTRTAEGREALREALRRRFFGEKPDGPFTLGARTWAVRGTVPE